MADALDLGSSVYDVQVQVLSPAPLYKSRPHGCGAFLFFAKGYLTDTLEHAMRHEVMLILGKSC